MAIVESIFGALGGPTAIADAMNLPVQTVSSWKSNKRIPTWRRGGVVEAAQRLGKGLEPEHLAYLTSPVREPQVTA